MTHKFAVGATVHYESGSLASARRSIYKVMVPGRNCVALFTIV